MATGNLLKEVIAHHHQQISRVSLQQSFIVCYILMVTPEEYAPQSVRRDASL